MGETQIKYVIHPGFVESKTDRDVHYIGYNAIIRLYKLKPDSCELYSPVKSYPTESANYEYNVHLYPRHDGDYNLETAVLEYKARKGITNV